MAARPLIPRGLSLALAWGGSAQAANNAAWPALSQPAGSRETRGGDAALTIAVEDYPLAQDLPGPFPNGSECANRLHCAGPLRDGSRQAFTYLTLGALRGWGASDDYGFVTVTAAGPLSDACRMAFETTTGRCQAQEWIDAKPTRGRSAVVRERVPENPLLRVREPDELHRRCAVMLHHFDEPFVQRSTGAAIRPVFEGGESATALHPETPDLRRGGRPALSPDTADQGDPRRPRLSIQRLLAFVALSTLTSACFTGAADLDAWHKDGSPDGSDGGNSSGSSGSGDGSGDGSSTGPAMLTDDLTGMVFLRIEPSSFEIGCTAGQSFCDSDQWPVMPVTLTYAHYMGETEVTQAQFEAAMGYNPSRFGGCENCPVEQIRWHEAAALSNALSSAAGLAPCYPCTGSGTDLECDAGADPLSCEGYRLPTEAEWEGAARCGGDTLYAGNDDADAVAWTNDNAGDETHPAGRKSANACGLYDMSGNVSEWVSDWYRDDYYRSSGRSDPSGPASGSYRVIRGGRWIDVPQIAQVAFRNYDVPGHRNDGLGVRLLRIAP
jgi:sulfatase modifying factor 1